MDTELHGAMEMPTAWWSKSNQDVHHGFSLLCNKWWQGNACSELACSTQQYKKLSVPRDNRTVIFWCYLVMLMLHILHNSQICPLSGNLCPLVHSPNGLENSNWAKQQLEAWQSMLLFMNGRAHALASSFAAVPGTLAGTGSKSGTTEACIATLTRDPDFVLPHSPSLPNLLLKNSLHVSRMLIPCLLWKCKLCS